jgi:hypothetical protein
MKIETLASFSAVPVSELRGATMPSSDVVQGASVGLVERPHTR